jgi:hypothetical protein
MIETRLATAGTVPNDTKFLMNSSGLSPRIVSRSPSTFVVNEKFDSALTAISP